MTNKLRVYRFIRDFEVVHRYAPTYREVADNLALSPGTVFRHVQSMRRMGYLQQGTRKMRCLKVVA